MDKNILVVNLGGTSTKVSIYCGTEHIATCSVSHSVEEMDMYPLSRDQVKFRKDLIFDFLDENNYRIDDFSGIVMRSPPVYVRKCGTYLVEGECRERILSFYHPDEKPEHDAYIAFAYLSSVVHFRDKDTRSWEGSIICSGDSALNGSALHMQSSEQRDCCNTWICACICFRADGFCDVVFADQ